MDSAPPSGSPSALPPSSGQTTSSSSRLDRVIGSLVGVFFLLLGLGAWLFFRDDPAPETSDLFPRWSRSQDPANPLAQFCTTASNAPLFWKRIGEKEIIEFEQSKSAAFQHFQQLINSPVETWAWTDQDNLLTWFKEDPIHLPISGIKNYLEAKHDLALTKDDQEEALICATHLLKLGTGIARAESNLNRLDIGTGIYFAGLKALDAAVRDLNTSAPLLRRSLNALYQHSSPASDDYAFAVRHSHLLAVKILETAKAQGAELSLWIPFQMPQCAGTRSRKSSIPSAPILWPTTVTQSRSLTFTS